MKNPPSRVKCSFFESANMVAIYNKHMLSACVCIGVWSITCVYTHTHTHALSMCFSMCTYVCVCSCRMWPPRVLVNTELGLVGLEVSMELLVSSRLSMF